MISKIIVAFLLVFFAIEILFLVMGLVEVFKAIFTIKDAANYFKDSVQILSGLATIAALCWAVFQYTKTKEKEMETRSIEILESRKRVVFDSIERHAMTIKSHFTPDNFNVMNHLLNNSLSRFLRIKNDLNEHDQDSAYYYNDFFQEVSATLNSNFSRLNRSHFFTRTVCDVSSYQGKKVVDVDEQLSCAILELLSLAQENDNIQCVNDVEYVQFNYMTSIYNAILIAQPITKSLIWDAPEGKDLQKFYFITKHAGWHIDIIAMVYLHGTALKDIIKHIR